MLSTICGVWRRTVIHPPPARHTPETRRFAPRLPVSTSGTYPCAVNVESFDERSGGIEEIDEVPEPPARPPRSSGAMGWLRDTNHSPAVIAFLRRARKSLPGDPDFGDPLSVDGVGGPRAAARAADRLLERDAASREVSLGALQVWQALTERVSGTPANREVTLVFTDLVGFSSWSLSAGDEATLKLLRRVSQVVEPPLLEAGGHIVKRMGDGMVAGVSQTPPAGGARVAAPVAVAAPAVDGDTPRRGRADPS